MTAFNIEKSKLKSKLKNKELTLGSWITIPSFQIIEIMGSAGFDWLTIDLEHAPIGIESVANLIAHIQSNGMQALVRVSQNEEVVIKKVLDAGADGIIVPMVKNRDEAQMAVNYAKYPPIGKRGVGLNRAHNYGTTFKEYKDWASEELVIIAQIEHIDAVNNIEEIISVNGIDGVIIGPYDLSASMGYPGEYNRKEVVNALNELQNKLFKHDFPSGFHVIESDSKYTIDKIKKGYTFLAFSIDFFFLGDLARNEMNKIKDALK